MAWTDPTLDETIKIRKSHIDEIVTRLNTERTERSLGTISISITANQSLIVFSHIMTIRTACDTTPLTIGCSTDNTTYNATVNSTVYGSQNSSYDIGANGSVCSGYFSSVNNGYQYVCTGYKGACFIGRNLQWLGQM